ncbi:MAG: ribosome assembly RNA-binding protein YhbY [Oscillospiraceae bacterium]|nr:ribosome assembly RNA-binding protein YhbY [Oscillospiraceae bacterium]MDD6146515.1 ribosome assembly RNA-binding protein YhbY [Oscillospiraceae bacterium]
MTGKERAAYRAQANHLEPLFQIGKGGLSDALLKQTDDALKARELIKLKVLLESSPVTARQAADEIAAALGAEVIQVIGGVIVLYRESPELREKAAQKEKNKKKAARLQKEKLYAERNESKGKRKFFFSQKNGRGSK